jgi:hypothetical protein
MKNGQQTGDTREINFYQAAVGEWLDREPAHRARTATDRFRCEADSWLHEIDGRHRLECKPGDKANL